MTSITYDDLRQARLNCIEALQEFFWDWQMGGYPPTYGWNAYINARRELGRLLGDPKEDMYEEIEMLEFAIKRLMSYEERQEWEESD